MTRTVAVVLGILLFGLCQMAQADTINVSTGLDATNTLITTSGQTDAHWALTSGPAPVIFSTSADWWGTYVANGPNSDWISNNASSSYNGPAPYTFQTTFDLTGYDLSTASMAGSWAIADGGTLSLNGNIIASLLAQTDTNWTGLHTFSVTTGSSYFVPGINTLTLTVTSSDSYYEAARLEGAVTAGSTQPPTVPEPSITLLLGAGCLGLLALGRMRLRS